MSKEVSEFLVLINVHRAAQNDERVHVLQRRQFLAQMKAREARFEVALKQPFPKRAGATSRFVLKNVQLHGSQISETV